MGRGTASSDSYQLLLFLGADVLAILLAITIFWNQKLRSAFRSSQARREADSQGHDLLTGLANRQYFRERLEQVLRQTDRKQKAAVLFLGLDRFKTVNDSLGHAAGDRVLRALAKHIEFSLHPGELAARFGGDEFTVLLENVQDASEAEVAAERILKSLSYPFQFEGHSLVISASIGIALVEDGMYPEEILRFADIAMYRAKARGGARHAIFESSIDARTMNVLQLESEIRQSLAAGDFRLYYQPIVLLASGDIVGFEALLRWQHPRRGVLLPAEFLPLAEESGLIMELGYWALQTACRHLRGLRSIAGARESLTVSVNLASKQFREPELANWLAGVLRENDLDGSALILELTESMIMENTSIVASRFEQLRQMGIRLAMDDFGKGHSSFGRLQDLQVSILKIDGAFVRRIDEGKPEIVDAMIAVAKKLKLEVTAECLETERQFHHLRDAGCTTGQGLYFSAALTASATVDLLKSKPSWSAPRLASAARS
jgi:diguanylate cyclase (GGDEF)-like protein